MTRYRPSIRHLLPALALLLTACAPTIGPGLKLTRLPERLAWCGPGPEQVPVRSVGALAETPGLLPPALFKKCQPYLRDECVSDSWVGSIVFGVSTDPLGAVTSVCVVGGNFGNALAYVQCAAEQISGSGYVFEKNVTRVPYTVHFVCD